MSKAPFRRPPSMWSEAMATRRTVTMPASPASSWSATPASRAVGSNARRRSRLSSSARPRSRDDSGATASASSRPAKLSSRAGARAARPGALLAARSASARTPASRRASRSMRRQRPRHTSAKSDTVCGDGLAPRCVRDVIVNLTNCEDTSLASSSARVTSAAASGASSTRGGASSRVMSASLTTLAPVRGSVPWSSIGPSAAASAAASAAGAATRGAASSQRERFPAVVAILASVARCAPWLTISSASWRARQTDVWRALSARLDTTAIADRTAASSVLSASA
mmetsp:Transcript_7938/g.23650  ORF Transcript_7938/g.23650 Transcript_7938/m.23650 type:complete len:284 (+) Transcript_7938:886-1737(+)